MHVTLFLVGIRAKRFYLFFLLTYLYLPLSSKIERDLSLEGNSCNLITIDKITSISGLPNFLHVPRVGLMFKISVSKLLLQG